MGFIKSKKQRQSLDLREDSMKGTTVIRWAASAFGNKGRVVVDRYGE
jgi:hypothetical protein